MADMHSRRTFLGLFLGASAVSAVKKGAFARSIHPEPREGITAELVRPDEEIAHMGEKVVEVFRMVREIPHVVDGIGCHCGCSTREGYYSLLTCFHEDGRAWGCPICQGEARLAYRRHNEGQTLDQIRRAIDARFG